MLDPAEGALDWGSLDVKSIERLADVEDGLAEDALDWMSLDVKSIELLADVGDDLGVCMCRSSGVWGCRLMRPGRYPDSSSSSLYPDSSSPSISWGKYL